MFWELSILLMVIAMIIGFLSGYFIRKSDIEFYQEQIDVMWERVNEKNKIIRKLETKNRELKGIKNAKYKWKDEK